MGISTTSLQNLIKTGLSTEIINKVTDESVIMRLAETKQMTAPTQSYPIRIDKAGSFWVNEGEKISTSQASWQTITLTAKKIGGISIMTKESVADGLINVKDEIRDQIANDIIAKLDNAALFGTGSPYGVGKSIFEKATKYTATGNVSDDVSDTMALVENANLDVNAFVGPRAIKNKLRKAKDEAGFYIFEDKKNGEPAQIHGCPLAYTNHFDKTKADLIAGDFSKVYLGILEDLEFEVLDQATVDGVNLAEEDKIAIKATMRLGFLVIEDDAFAVLEPKVVTP